jgi:type I restriction enzyme M protein
LSQNAKIPPLFRDIFKKAFLPYRDPETLNLFLKEINWFTYTHSEDLGDAFEHLLSVMGSQGDAGQFRTPRHIIDFIVAVVDPRKDETILDPACGTAGFLISAYKHIMRQNAGHIPGDKLTPDEKTTLMNQIVGYDISPDMVRLSLVNMYLHKFPNPNVYEYDTLTNEAHWEENFDVILTNPPFMSPKGGIRPHKHFAIQANRSEVLFVDYIAEHLNVNGRAGVIVPEGIIFQSGNAYKKLREQLLNNGLYAVISLPSGVFQPYSGVKTSILFIDKQFAKSCDQMLFVDIKDTGVSLGATQAPIELNDLKPAEEIIRKFKNGILIEQSRLAFTADKRAIVSSKYELSLSRHRKIIPVNSKCSFASLHKICDISKGKSSSTKTAPGEYRLFLTADDLKTADHFDFNGEGVCVPLISSKGHGKAAIKRVHYVKGKFALADLLAFVEPKNTEIINPKYLYFYLNIKKDEIAKLMKGAANVSMKVADLERYQIPVLAIEKQLEIVSEIESYQRIIDGARQVVENYKPQIKIDPTWPLVELGSTAKIKGGFAFNSSEFVDHGIQVIRMGNIEMHNLILNKNPVYIPLERINEFDKFILKKGDVIITMTGTQGKRDYGEVAMIKDENWYLLNQRVGKIEILSNDILPEYLLYILSDPIYQDEIFKTASGIRQANISGQQLENILIPLPPLVTQQSIVAQIEKEQDLVDANKQLIQIYEQKIKSKIAEVWET